MKLYYTPTSPFARKVRILAIEVGLDRRIELIKASPWSDDHPLQRRNPLGKVPALVTDEGEVLYDSPVICEYLDSLTPGPKLFPEEGWARWRVLRQQALADGILDAAVLRRMEGQRPEGQRSSDWDGIQKGAVVRGLDALEQEASAWGDALTIGQVTAACALGYLDFRFHHEDWRDNRPRLRQWYAGICERISMKATAPAG